MALEDCEALAIFGGRLVSENVDREGEGGERGKALPVLWVPDSDTRVQAACCYSLAVEGDCIDLAEMALECA